MVNWTCFIFHWKYYDWWKRSFDQETWGFTMFHCPACNRLTLWMSTEHEGYTQQWPMRLSMSPAVSRMSQLLMKSDKLVSIHLNGHALNFFTFAVQTKWSSQTHKRSGFWIYSYLIIYMFCLFQADQKKTGRRGLWGPDIFKSGIWRHLALFDENMATKYWGYSYIN